MNGDYRVIHGECQATMALYPDNCIDAMVTDPPAGIDFMNREWDNNKGGRDQWIEWLSGVMEEAWRILKPGAHGFIWALPRTSHWTATALEDAGFEIRDCIYHIFGTGFPKSRNISKDIDQMAGVEREIVGQSPRHGGGTNHVYGKGMGDGNVPMLTAPATAAAKQWDGFRTALKPAVECWWLIRKPISCKSIAENVLNHGTGALNIDACKVPLHGDVIKTVQGGKDGGGYDVGSSDASRRTNFVNTEGRWPPHLLLTCNCEQYPEEGCPVAELDRQSGTTKSCGKPIHAGDFGKHGVYGIAKGALTYRFTDEGGASRFFPTFRYQAKPSRKEKQAGLEGLPIKNDHTTIKGIELCRWLSRLICPPGGILIDPFTGSGSIGCAAVLEGFSFLGIDSDEHYCEIARARIEHWRKQREKAL